MSMNVTQTAPRAPMAAMPEGCEHGMGSSGPIAPGIPKGRVPIFTPAVLQQLDRMGIDIEGLKGDAKLPRTGADLLGGDVAGAGGFGDVPGAEMLGKQMPSFDFGASRAKVGQALGGMREPSSPPNKTVD